MTTQCHLCQLSIIQEKGDLVTRSIQPDDVQRIVAFSRAIRIHTFVFRPSFVSTLPHWTLWAAYLPFVLQTKDATSLSTLPSSAMKCKARSAHFLRTSAEKSGVRMSALKKGLKVSLSCIDAGSILIRNKKLAVRPVPCWPK